MSMRFDGMALKRFIAAHFPDAAGRIAVQTHKGDRPYDIDAFENDVREQLTPNAGYSPYAGLTAEALEGALTYFRGGVVGQMFMEHLREDSAQCATLGWWDDKRECFQGIGAAIIFLPRGPVDLKAEFAVIAGVMNDAFHLPLSPRALANYPELNRRNEAYHELAHALCAVRGIDVTQKHGVNAEEMLADCFAALLLARDFGASVVPYLEHLRDCRMLGAVHKAPKHFTVPVLECVLDMLKNQGASAVRGLSPEAIFMQSRRMVAAYGDVFCGRPIEGLALSDTLNMQAGAPARTLNDLFRAQCRTDYFEVQRRYRVSAHKPLAHFWLHEIERDDKALTDSLKYNTLLACATYLVDTQHPRVQHLVARNPTRAQIRAAYGTELDTLDRVVPGLGGDMHSAIMPLVAAGKAPVDYMGSLRLKLIGRKAALRIKAAAYTA